MPSPKFQIFVSSTFRDLQEERRAVLDAILELNHFPAGMEMFPASDSTPMEVIERVIRDSDYYVLIIGGCYGSTNEEGISYTEAEYDYAVAQGKTALVFVHADPGSIPANKSEMNPGARKKLVAFRKRVEDKHHRKAWKNAEDLKAKVIVGLSLAFSSHPAVGWVRADGIDDTELLKRLTDLQQRYDQLRDENSVLKSKVGSPDSPIVPGLADGCEQFEVYYEVLQSDKQITKRILISWNDLFFCVANMMMTPVADEYIHHAFGVMLNERTGHQDASISSESFGSIRLQFIALSLVSMTHVRESQRDIRTRELYTQEVNAWVLTQKGLRLLAEHQAVKRQSDNSTS